MAPIQPAPKNPNKPIDKESSRQRRSMQIAWKRQRRSQRGGMLSGKNSLNPRDSSRPCLAFSRSVPRVFRAIILSFPVAELSLVANNSDKPIAGQHTREFVRPKLSRLIDESFCRVCESKIGIKNMIMAIIVNTRDNSVDKYSIVARLIMINNE